CYIQNCPIG
nr:mesotocin [Pelophylax lessonae]prf//671037A mesotocin [Batrachoididae gen. sp.]prf//690927A mesotocin [Serpentes]prf//701182A mesotocin [Galliformes]prf//701188A mesotocin [Protopterus annectens]